MIIIYEVIMAVSIVCMIGALIIALRLLRLTRGGKIGRTIRLLLGFIVFFLLGYLVAPFCVWLPAEWILSLTAVIFLFGAVFVTLVLRLIRNLVEQVFEELRI